MAGFKRADGSQGFVSAAGKRFVPAGGVPRPPDPPAPTGARIFKPTAWCYQDISSAPVHANSAGIAAYFDDDRRAQFNGSVGLNVYSYTPPIYEVDGSTPRHAVGFSDYQLKRFREDGLLRQLTSVPIPAGAVPAEGTDREILLLDRAGDRMWEGWIAYRIDGGRAEGSYQTDEAGRVVASGGRTFTWYGNPFSTPLATAPTWFFTWGGRMENLSTSEAIFPGNYGTTATSIPFLAGIITAEEVHAGVIEHCIGISPTKVRSGGQSWPATRNDGWVSDANAPYEGMRFRFRPEYNFDTMPGLHRIARIVGKAGQKYGFCVWDKSGGHSVRGEHPQTYTARGLPNPWVELAAGTPLYQVLDGLPWRDALWCPFDFGKPA